MAKNICSLSYPLTGKLVLSTKHAETHKACFHHTPFTGYDRQERDIAALFLLDMSGCTKGWIMEAEKEAFVLMAEALETLGNRHAVYGFPG